MDSSWTTIETLSSSTESAHEVTENSHDDVSEYFSVASSSTSPQETFESCSSFFSTNSSTSIVTESDEISSITSGSYSISTESDSDYNGIPDVFKTVKKPTNIVFAKDFHRNLMQKLRKLKFSVEERRYSQVIAELKEKFKLEKAARDEINSSTDSGLDSDETNQTVQKDQSCYNLEEGKKQNKKHIYINEHIISQTEKMLKYGVKTPKFIGSLAHLEAERILLVSRTRRQILINYRVPAEPINEAVAKITIEKLKCMLDLPQETNRKRQYFVCILQHKTTVHSTKFATANSQGLVEFGGFFIFENVSNTFNFKIQLYCITLPKNSKGCMVLPFLLKNCKLPQMELIGEVPVSILDIKNKKFSFKNSKNNEHKLLASIEASVIWPEPLRGFVTVGTGKIDQYPTWDKRWCVIEKAVLSYFNYPSDENCNPPLGKVDLKLCKSIDNDTVKYMGQKTLRLFIQKENNFERVFLSPDNDYDLWSKHLDIVLKLNNQWNSFKH